MKASDLLWAIPLLSLVALALGYFLGYQAGAASAWRRALGALEETRRQIKEL